MLQQEFGRNENGKPVVTLPEIIKANKCRFLTASLIRSGFLWIISYKLYFFVATMSSTQLLQFFQLSLLQFLIESKKK